MTGLGHSPPRSKKESSDADEISNEPVAEQSESVPQPDEPRDADEPDAGEVKAAAKAQRAEVRERAKASKMRARSDVAAAKAAEQADARAAKQAARDAKAAARADRRDRIVEAPREPKKSIVQKLRRDGSASGGGSGISGRRRFVAMLSIVVGAAGLICSIVLAIGALLVALGADETSALYETIANICDVLVGPLRDVFSFSGANAAMKEALVAWGAGSIGYLVVGLAAQSMLRSAAED